jgi:dTDP-4-amino-4,6-dideoxygalactose transaminase
MKVPMYRSNLSREIIRNQLREAFDSVIDSENLILGGKVHEFEREFENYLGTNHCVGVANGTDAIELALRALGVTQGSKVATVANAGFYTSTATHALSGIPVYMDVSLSHGLVTYDEVENVINREKPKVLVLTHLYGQVIPEILKIVNFAKSKGVAILEDCAQAHGASLHGKKAGTFGDIATFSFYPTKNLGALGDGGAVVTSSLLLKERLVSLRQYGWIKKYTVQEIGRNSRLDELQAAFLLTFLPKLDENNELRVQAARMYLDGINERADYLQHVSREWTTGYVAHLCVVRVNDSLRDSLMQHLEEKGVSFAIHYPTPDHHQPALRMDK